MINCHICKKDFNPGTQFVLDYLAGVIHDSTDFICDECLEKTEDPLPEISEILFDIKKFFC